MLAFSASNFGSATIWQFPNVKEPAGTHLASYLALVGSQVFRVNYKSMGLSLAGRVTQPAPLS